MSPEIQLDSKFDSTEESCATGNCARPALHAGATTKERLAWWFRGMLTPCALVRVFAVVIFAMAIFSSV